MRDYEPEGPTPALLAGASRYFVAAALLAVGAGRARRTFDDFGWREAP
jgi:hypothetical protein